MEVPRSHQFSVILTEGKVSYYKYGYNCFNRKTIREKKIKAYITPVIF